MKNNVKTRKTRVQIRLSSAEVYALHLQERQSYKELSMYFNNLIEQMRATKSPYKFKPYVEKLLSSKEVPTMITKAKKRYSKKISCNLKEKGTLFVNEEAINLLKSCKCYGSISTIIKRILYIGSNLKAFAKLSDRIVDDTPDHNISTCAPIINRKEKLKRIRIQIDSSLKCEQVSKTFRAMFHKCSAPEIIGNLRNKTPLTSTEKNMTKVELFLTPADIELIDDICTELNRKIKGKKPHFHRRHIVEEVLTNNEKSNCY